MITSAEEMEQFQGVMALKSVGLLLIYGYLSSNLAGCYRQIVQITISLSG